MRRPLPLTAYLMLRRRLRPPERNAPPLPPRPPGPVVWVHCPEAARIGAMMALSDRMGAQDGDRLTFLLTSPGIAAAAAPGIVGTAHVLMQPAPPEQRGALRAFLRHWNPDLLLWMHGDLRPLALIEADRAGIPRMMIDADAAGIAARSGAWLPGLTRALLAPFEAILAIDEDAAARLRRLRVEEDRIEVAGALDAGTLALPCNERERRDLAQTLGTRPVWLAVEPPLAEVDALAAAHRQASRRAHRLLLILVPADLAQGPQMAEQLRAAGFVTALRSDGAEPEEATQVYVADASNEMGLWYRLSPISYLGGTLSGGGGRNPFEPAALGSALLHGTQTDPHGGSYARLERAGASCPVRTPADLGSAVETLLAPDRAAAMAHAAWDVTSSGAEVTNRVMDLIRDRLAGAAR